MGRARCGLRMCVSGQMVAILGLSKVRAVCVHLCNVQLIANHLDKAWKNRNLTHPKMLKSFFIIPL
jgi:hypothetical protein